MSVVERLSLFVIGMLAGCAVTLVGLGLPLLPTEPQLATNCFTAASIAGFAALAASIVLSATRRKRPY